MFSWSWITNSDSFDEALPEPIPYPTYDFSRAAAKAKTEKTWFASQNDFRNYLDDNSVYINDDGIDNDVDGIIDEPAIWNRSLSADEIAFLYELGKFHLETDQS